MSTLPTYKIEIAFNAGPTTPAASRTWTNVTQWVLFGSGIDIDYGRGDWRSNADANTVRLTLNNSDGRFTAGLTSSPYYPNVKIGRPVRVTATLGTASTRVVGFIDEWPVEWPATVGTFATATISASSRLAWLGNRAELRSIIEEEILLDSPVAYYTLGEAAGATSANDSSGNSAPRLTSAGTGTAVVFGSATGPGTDGLTAATFAGGKYLKVSLGSFTLAAVECWFSTTYTPASTLVNLIGINDEDLLTIFEGLNVGSQLPGGSSILGDVADGAVHHIAYIPGTGFYLDGLFDTDFATPPVVTTLNIGHAENSPGVNWQGSIAHVVAYATAPSGARFIAHYGAGSDGFAGETPAARLTRYASFAGIAATELNLETGMVPDLAHIDTTGKTAVDWMRTVEATEEGILFDAQDGKLTFHARNHRYSAASAFTLNVPTGQVDVGISPRLDRLAMRNDVSAQSTDGTVTARATNATSIDDYGPARESLDLATTNAEEPFQHASWIVNTYGSPIPRVPQLGVKLANLPTTIAQAVLAATIGTRFTVTGMPAQAESSSQDYFIEGYSERIGEGHHDITFNVSQAEPFDVWTVEDPVLGQYDAYPIAF